MLRLSREPDFALGRFFMSPILGCSANCAFCYIFSEGYSFGPTLNSYTLADSIKWICCHDQYRAGRDGSVISIGAWGDPFPPGDSDAAARSIRWIEVACGLGNPVQLMSRFRVPEWVAREVASFVLYPNQLLFSTSISTFRLWRRTESLTDSPSERLETLDTFRTRGIPVNIMIKPFLLGITEAEIEQFLLEMERHEIQNCVVGDLYWDERIRRRIEASDICTCVDVPAYCAGGHSRRLDCSKSQLWTSRGPGVLDDFIGQLRDRGISSYKKSTCVNANLLRVDNPSQFRLHDPDGYCIRCGNCGREEPE